SILPLLADEEKESLEIAQSAISEYNTIYHETWLSGMRKKIGLCNEETEDAALVQDLLAIWKSLKQIIRIHSVRLPLLKWTKWRYSVIVNLPRGKNAGINV